MIKDTIQKISSDMTFPVEILEVKVGDDYLQVLTSPQSSQERARFLDKVIPQVEKQFNMKCFSNIGNTWIFDNGGKK